MRTDKVAARASWVLQGQRVLNMKQPTYADLSQSGVDIRRTIATEGGKLKGFTKDHAKTRMRNSSKIYGSIKRSK